MEGTWIVRDPDALPPLQYRLINYGEKFPTPTDDRGVVDIPKTIKLVKSTVDPSYRWHGEPSVHHFLHPESSYPYIDEPDQANPAHYRNLPIFKGLVPRDFENWLHRITLPPPLPEEEVMIYMTEAWDVARDLFKMARKTVQWERHARGRRANVIAKPQILKEKFDGIDVIGEEIIKEVFLKNFRGLEYQFRRLETIPPEFRLVEKEESPKRLATSLGRFAIHGSYNLVNAVVA
jgi:hypothetical protein